MFNSLKTKFNLRNAERSAEKAFTEYESLWKKWEETIQKVPACKEWINPTNVKIGEFSDDVQHTLNVARLISLDIQAATIAIDALMERLATDYSVEEEHFRKKRYCIFGKSKNELSLYRRFSISVDEYNRPIPFCVQSLIPVEWYTPKSHKLNVECINFDKIRSLGSESLLKKVVRSHDPKNTVGEEEKLRKLLIADIVANCRNLPQFDINTLDLHTLIALNSILAHCELSTPCMYYYGSLGIHHKVPVESVNIFKQLTHIDMSTSF